MKVNRFFWIGLLVWGFVSAESVGDLAAAPKYPTKPVQVIIAFQPGDTDVNLRPYIEKMPDYLGQPMTLTYKPGAGGALGASFVVSSKPDGYTLLGSTQSAMVILPITQKTISYTLDSFAPICCLVETYSVMVVQSNARWKNLPELAAEAKKNPGQISFTSPGSLAIQHLLVEAFAEEAGIKLNHVPAQGSGPAITALLGGHVDMAVGSLSTAMPHIQAGAIRPIGIFAEKRIRALPTYPTVIEQGYAVRTPLIYGFVGPKDVPNDIVNTLSSAAKKVLDSDRSYVSERLDKLGAEILFLGPDQYGANLKTQSVYFQKVVKGMNK
jgi:tripartite-type tricarboxylate transporter receptor subunit TctC